MTSTPPAAATLPDPQSQTAADVVSRCQGMLDTVFRDEIAALKANGCALVDFPDHGNVGDSAIWSGQVAWLDRHGIVRRLAGDLNIDLAQIRALPAEVPVLLHGGGNFGDLWPRHQLFRERVLAEFPDRRVIQLPQSIHYDDAAMIAPTREAIARHPRFLLLVRDHPSLDLARQNFACDVRLCPDMAFAMGVQPRPVQPDADVLMLLRTDSERQGYAEAVDVPEGWVRADWLQDDPDVWTRAAGDARRRAILSFNPARMGGAARHRDYLNRLSDRRVDRGLRLLSRARYVITDRLHVHILCTLMNIPHCVLDNRYGKIARLSQAFGTRWSGVSQAATLPEAVATARARLERREPQTA